MHMHLQFRQNECTYYEEQYDDTGRTVEESEVNCLVCMKVGMRCMCVCCIRTQALIAQHDACK